jgi:hypothetical protein
MNTELRNNIRKRWLRSLFEFAHLDFQERLWILADYPNSIGDYSEAICQYFNDLSLEEGYSEFIEEGIISKNELDVVRDFHIILNVYTEKPEKKNLSDNKILRDPEWKNICVIAKSNWDKLKYIIESDDELTFMQSLESEFLN